MRGGAAGAPASRNMPGMLPVLSVPIIMATGELKPNFWKIDQNCTFLNKNDEIHQYIVMFFLMEVISRYLVAFVTNRWFPDLPTDKRPSSRRRPAGSREGTLAMS